MLKIGVLGAGHLGKIHIKLLKEIENVELIGFFDPDYVNAALVEAQYNVKWFDNMAALIAQSRYGNGYGQTCFYRKTHVVEH